MGQVAAVAEHHIMPCPVQEYQPRNLEKWHQQLAALGVKTSNYDAVTDAFDTLSNESDEIPKNRKHLRRSHVTLTTLVEVFKRLNCDEDALQDVIDLTIDKLGERQNLHSYHTATDYDAALQLALSEHLSEQTFLPR